MLNASPHDWTSRKLDSLAPNLARPDEPRRPQERRAQTHDRPAEHARREVVVPLDQRRRDWRAREPEERRREEGHAYVQAVRERLLRPEQPSTHPTWFGHGAKDAAAPLYAAA